MENLTFNLHHFFISLVAPCQPMFAKIEGYSDVIVEGRPTGETEQVLVKTSGLYVIHGYTLTTVAIDKVYKGTIRAGDTIKIAEPYCVTDNTIYHRGLYYPSETEKSYIWLLTDMRPNYEHYAFTMCERGRYPVIDMNAAHGGNPDDLSKEELNLCLSGQATEETIYRTIFREVVAKYMKQDGTSAQVPVPTQ